MGLFDQIISGALRGAMGQGGGATESSLLPGLLGQLLGQTNLGGIGPKKAATKAARPRIRPD